MPNHRLCLSALTLLSALAFTHPTRADVQITKSIRYFAIGGKTASELDQQLSNHGPLMRKTGARHPGATRIKFGGTVTYVERNGKCAVGASNVTLSTRLILPRWTNRRRTDKDLAFIWDTLSRDIKRHEERHAEIARNHARAMEKTFLALHPESDCERMQARLDRASADAIVAHDKDQARFDRVESANFNDRMMRLLSYGLKSRQKLAK